MCSTRQAHATLPAGNNNGAKPSRKLCVHCALCVCVCAYTFSHEKQIKQKPNRNENNDEPFFCGPRSAAPALALGNTLAPSCNFRAVQHYFAWRKRAKTSAFGGFLPVVVAVGFYRACVATSVLTLPGLWRCLLSECLQIMSKVHKCEWHFPLPSAVAV